MDRLVATALFVLGLALFALVVFVYTEWRIVDWTAMLGGVVATGYAAAWWGGTRG